MRSLTAQEFNQAEQIKFAVLYNIDYLQQFVIDLMVDLLML